MRETLLRAGIAPRHVRRYIAELGDHLDDLVHEETSEGLPEDAAEQAARARLGNDDVLAASFLARPGLRSVTARFPCVVFGFGSAFMLAIAVVAAVLLEGGVLRSHLLLTLVFGKRPPVAPPEWLKVSVWTWNALIVYAAPFAVAAAVYALGLRQRMSVTWIMLGATIVCVLGGFHEVGVRWSDPPAQSELYASFLGPQYSQAMVIACVVRVAANIAVLAAAYWLWLRPRYSAYGTS